MNQKREEKRPNLSREGVKREGLRETIQRECKFILRARLVEYVKYLFSVFK